MSEQRTVTAWAVPMALVLGAGGMYAFSLARDRPEPLADLAPAVALRDQLSEAPQDGATGGNGEVEEPDSDPALDPQHLTPKDLLFLEEVLTTGIPEGRLSAARVLRASSDARGVPLLFDASVRHPDQAGLFCLAALEVIRLQAREDGVAMLWRAMERAPALGRDCLAEVRDRFALAGGRDATVLVRLADADEPRLRAFVARALSDMEHEGVEAALIALAQDPVIDVREAAWVGLSERAVRDVDALEAARAAETEPHLVSLAAQAGP